MTKTESQHRRDELNNVRRLLADLGSGLSSSQRQALDRRERELLNMEDDNGKR